jgi:hypothetical protein
MHQITVLFVIQTVDQGISGLLAPGSIGAENVPPDFVEKISQKV